jgi:hypothetical protein
MQLVQPEWSVLMLFPVFMMKWRIFLPTLMTDVAEETLHSCVISGHRRGLKPQSGVCTGDGLWRRYQGDLVLRIP